MSDMVQFFSSLENVSFDEKKCTELMGETLSFDVRASSIGIQRVNGYNV